MLLGNADDVRIEMAGDLPVAYLPGGSGPRLVLLHGLAQDHRTWSQVQEALGDFLTLACDLRGHGSTPLGKGDGTIAQLGNDLVSFLERVGPSVCVGFSLGGVVALWAAAERADLVNGVVAIATSSVVGKAAAASLAERIELFREGEPATIRSALLSDTRAQLADPKVDPVAVADQRVAALPDPTGYINGARAVLSMREQSVHDRLADISAPVLVVNGEHDRWCPRRAAEIMLEQLKTATFVELPGCGHLVTHDAPIDLAATVRDWLESKGEDDHF
ncbi:MAG: alpha/beta fold hydrolase [Actinomycetota bacterium]